MHLSSTSPRVTTLIVDNAQWLARVGLLDFLRDVGKAFTVNEMIRKDSVRSRLEGRDQGLSFAEFAYQLCQAWDFVQLYERHGCRLQLGGSDQWGNITAGIELVRRLAGGAAFGLTSPLVTKADGTKFGKTESGTVWLSAERTSPYQFFQFWLRTPDAEVGEYLRRFTFLDAATITALDEEVVSHPERRAAQRRLAQEVTTMVHGADEASRAERAAEVLFTDEVPSLDAATLTSALADMPMTDIDATTWDAGLAPGGRPNTCGAGLLKGAGPPGAGPGWHLRQRSSRAGGSDPEGGRPPSRPLRAPASGKSHL